MERNTTIVENLRIRCRRTVVRKITEEGNEERGTESAERETAGDRGI